PRSERRLLPGGILRAGRTAHRIFSPHAEQPRAAFCALRDHVWIWKPRYASGFDRSSRFMILQLNRSNRHDGGNGVLVDELNLAVAAQQDTEIIEPGDV